jgi:plastocyanin domain-containing protein
MKKSLTGALAVLALVATPAVVLAQTGSHASGHAAKAAPAQKSVAARVDKNGVRVVELTVTPAGFEPANVAVKAGKPVRLVITRKTDKTCATELVLEDLGINQPLPLDTPVTVEFTPSESGQLRYACAMNHVSGVLTVQ